MPFPLLKVALRNQSQTATTLLSHSQTLSWRCWLRFHCFARLWWGYGRVAPGQRKEHLMGPSRTRIYGVPVRAGTCTSILAAPPHLPACQCCALHWKCMLVHRYPCRWMKRVARQQYMLRVFLRRILALFGAVLQVLLPKIAISRPPGRCAQIAASTRAKDAFVDLQHRCKLNQK